MAGKTEGDVAAYHKSCADMHADQATHYLEMCKAMEGETPISTNDDSEESVSSLKTFGMLATRDANTLNKIRPDGVRGVLPDAPGVTLVPRFGAAPVEKNSVPAEFADLVKAE